MVLYRNVTLPLFA